MTQSTVNLSTVTILNVDGSEAARAAKGHLLRAAGYHVIDVETGKEALRLAREAKPQLAIIDVKLPDLDGLDVCRTLKSDPTTSPMMVLLMSAVRGLREEKIAGLELGAEAYLIEPVDSDELLTTVKSLLRLHDSERRLHLALNASRDNEEALHRSRQHLELISDAVPSLISYIGSDLRYRTCNHAYEVWFGVTREQIVGKPVREILGEDAWKTVEPLIQQAFAGRTVEFETEIIYRNTGPRWVHVVYTPDQDGHGHVSGIVVMVHDITARKRAEEALEVRSRQRERLYELASAVNRADALSNLYEKTIDAILSSLDADRASILLFDASGAMRFRAWRELSESYRRAVEGHSPWKQGQTGAMPILIEDVQSSDIDQTLKDVIHREGIRALAFIPLNYGGAVIGKFMVYFDRPHKMTAEQIVVAQGIADTLATGIERKRAEEALAESEERFHKAFRWASVGQAQLDAKTWRFIDVNEQFCRMTGYQREELLALTPLDLTHREDRTTDVKGFGRMLAGETDHYTVEKRYVRKDGSIIWVQVEAALIRDAQGRPYRTIAAILDISERKKAEESLLESELRYRSLVSVITDIPWTTDAAGAFVEPQPAWEQYTGQSWEQHKSFGWANALHPDERESIKTAWLQACQAKSVYAVACRLWHARTEQWRYIEGRATPLLTEDGAVQRWVGSYTDVHERRCAEEALRAREAELEAIVTRTPFLLTRCSKDMRYQFVSKAYADMLGRTADEIVGKPIVEMIGQTGFCTIFPHIEKVLQGQRVEFESDVHFEGKGVRTLHVNYTPDRGDEGEIKGWIASIVDITERRRAEAAWRESEERLRLAMAAGDMGAWDILLENGIVTWDEKQCELFGRPAQNPVRHIDEFYALVHPDDVSAVRKAADSAEKTGRFSEEFRILRPDGTVRWIAGHGVSITDSNGHPLRMVGVNYDITDQKESQTRLKRFAEELERLVQERTLELVQSQARLRGLATELSLTEQRERKKLATLLHDHLAQLLVLCRLKLSQTKRLAGVSQSCLKLIKSTDEVLSDAMTFTRTLVGDLAPPVLHDLGLPAALTWLSDSMSRYEMAVSVDIDEGLDPGLPEDQAMLLFQSVRELLMNCYKHADTKEASVSLAQQGHELRIQVKDSGKGFLVAVATDDVPDTKFGLFSIHERMRALGGTFEIESAPGKGTKATLRLPLGNDVRRKALGVRCVEPSEAIGHRPSAVRSSGVASRLTPNTSRVRVLLADDHAMVRQGLRSMLETYADVEIVGEAATGEEAIAGVVKWEPDVVIMDINMPRLNGIEATARIKSRYPDVVIIGLSVQSGEEPQQAMLKAGATLLLTKEAAVDQLYESIRKMWLR